MIAGLRGVLLALSLLGAAVAAVAGIVQAEDPALAAAGWQEIRFDALPSDRYSAGADGSIRVESDKAASMLFRAVEADPAKTPLLRWRWRVDSPAAVTDLTRKGGDDRSLAVYVGFRWEPEKASLWERMKRAVVEAKSGPGAPGRVIAYIWGGAQPAGSLSKSPYSGDGGWNVILRDGAAPLATWLDETVDVAADYARAFGSNAPEVTWIALFADGDDTASRVSGAVAGLDFSPR